MHKRQEGHDPDAKQLPHYTEMEIRHILQDELKEELQNLRNGAQASINVAELLYGNQKLGLEGFAPSIERRMKALEDWAHEKDHTDDERWDTEKARLDKIESRQTFVKRTILKTTKVIDWKIVAGAVILWILHHFPLWYPIKHFLLWLSTTLSSAR